MKVNIGEIIKAKVKERGMTYTEFTDRLEMKRSGVYSMFARSNIDTDLLDKVCQVLSHDFYQYFLEKETLDELIKKSGIKKTKVIVELELTDEDIKLLSLEERAKKSIYSIEPLQNVAEESAEYSSSSDSE